MLKLEVEKFPYSPVRAVGVPYPTAFHPSGKSAWDVWVRKVARSRRKYRWTYMAIGEASDKETRGIRRELVKQCRESGQCLFKNCSKNDEGEGSLQHRMGQSVCAYLQILALPAE
jgi:hypothetical protein